MAQGQSPAPTPGCSDGREAVALNLADQSGARTGILMLTVSIKLARPNCPCGRARGPLATDRRGALPAPGEDAPDEYAPNIGTTGGWVSRASGSRMNAGPHRSAI